MSAIAVLLAVNIAEHVLVSSPEVICPVRRVSILGSGDGGQANQAQDRGKQNSPAE
jgi:hypothetical protein